MPRGRPVEGAPGWRVIEHRRRQSWRAGYVIVPLAVCAGIFLGLAPFQTDWLEWPEQQALETAATKLLQAQEPKLAEAPEPEPSEPRKVEFSEILESLVPNTGDSSTEIRGAERFEPQPASLEGGIASRAGVDEVPLPTLKPTDPKGASPDDEVTASTDPQSSSPTRIFIHRTMGDADAAVAERLTAFLRARGFTVAAVRVVDFRIDVPSVRYFFDSDQASSRRLLDAIEAFYAAAPGRAPEQTTDFTHFSPKPRQGNVEVWLQTRATGWTRSARIERSS